MKKALKSSRHLLTYLLTYLLACLFVLIFVDCALADASIPLVIIEGESLTEWQGKTDVREAVLTYMDSDTGVSFTRRITIRPQGTSSLGFEKKNFTIQMTDKAVEVSSDWGEQSLYCLKANYIDPTHAGNVVSARLAAQMNAAYGLFEDAPNNGVIDGFPVWVILNDSDAGLYTWNIPKSSWMFGMDENNPNHIVMCCEDWTDGCMFRQNYYIPDTEWSVEVGPENSATVEKFARLLHFVVDSDDETFVEQFDQYLNLDACLNYYCFICITNAVDNYGKNTLMTTYDGLVWAPSLYDLDSLWGIKYDGSAALSFSEETTLYARSDNYLFTRIRTLFSEELQTRYAKLRSTILSNEHIQEEFNSFVTGIPESAYESDQEMWNSDGRMIRTLDLMWSLMDEYWPIIDASMGYTVSAN